MRQAAARSQRMSAQQVYADWLQQILKQGDGGVAQPADWQETHSPTEAVEVTISKGTRRTQERCRRRQVDALLWRAVEGENGEYRHRAKAAECIEKAFALVTQGVCVKIQSFQRNGLAYHADWRAQQAELVDWYQEWARGAEDAGLNVSDVLQILVHGEPLRDQDKRNRQKNGRATEHLIESLEVYAKLRRWG